MSRPVGPVPLARANEPKAVPLAERLPHAVHSGTILPNWVHGRGPAKARPLRAGTESIEVVPVAKSAEEEYLAERERELENARNEAELEGLKMGQAKVEMLIERYLDAIKRLGQTAKKARRPSAEEIVELAFVVAQEIIGRELTNDREIIAKKLDEVMVNVTADSSTIVKLSGADLTYIKRRRPELAAAGVQFVEDPSLGPGGCKVETPKAQIDIAVAARLKAVRAEITAIVAEATAAKEKEKAAANDDDMVVGDDAEELEIE